MMIHSDKCKELGFPAPLSSETQRGYVLRVIAKGHTLNTRVCRYIGIHNLHSIASSLANKRVVFTLRHGRAYCPFTRETPSLPVDIISMTPEQQSSHQKR